MLKSIINFFFKLASFSRPDCTLIDRLGDGFSFTCMSYYKTALLLKKMVKTQFSRAHGDCYPLCVFH